ncbi:MAG: Mfa1 family fimbria major subunit [Phocaeicola sp.]
MRIQEKLSLIAIYSLLVTGCSKDNIAEVENQTIGDKAYVSVNIVSPSSTDRSLKEFEVGTNEENKVNEVMLFFFKDGTGCVDAVTFNPTFTENTTNGTTNEGAISSAVVVLENPKIIPTSVIAVLNPTAAIKLLTKPDLSELTNLIETFSTKAPFVLSNSVYANSTKETVINATPLSGNQICKTKELALVNPVNIAVERVVAKVAVDMGKVTTPNGANSQLIVDGASLNVNINLVGWKVTETVPKSYLLKSIDNGWNETWWNDPSNKRSYWAKSYTLSQEDKYGYHSYSDISENLDPEYCLENTTNSKYTKIIVAAQLQDSEGNPIELMEWNGVKYLKTTMIDYIKGSGSIQQYYTKKIDMNNIETYSSLPADAIDFTTEGVTTGVQNKVIPTLSAAYTSKTFYTLSGTTPNITATEVTVDDVKASLKAFGEIKYWNEGSSYYFIEIKHNDSKEGGLKGIVRNHYYKLLINSVTGPGISVPDKEVKIVPSPDKDEDSYLAATITILSWNVVSQTVDLK